MRITIITAGSRGDVQPYVALGLGLKEAGYEVTLAAPATFEGLVRERGLGFYPISLDPLQGIRRQLEKGDANFLEFARRSRGILAPVLSAPALERLVRVREAALGARSRPAQSFWFEVRCGLEAQVGGLRGA